MSSRYTYLPPDSQATPRLLPLPKFTTMVDKEDAHFKPHPDAQQYLTLKPRHPHRNGQSYVWDRCHWVQSFGVYKLRVKNFHLFDPSNVKKSPMFACCNLCGTILSAKPPTNTWTNGSMARHLFNKHNILNPEKEKKIELFGKKRSKDGKQKMITLPQFFTSQTAKGVNTFCYYC